MSSVFSVLFSKIMEGGLLKRYVKDKKKECSVEKNLIGEGRWRNRCTVHMQAEGMLSLTGDRDKGDGSVSVSADGSYGRGY
jgi:hypothetical protein